MIDSSSLASTDPVGRTADVGGNSSAGQPCILENSLVASWKGENSDERVFFSELTDSHGTLRRRYLLRSQVLRPSLARFRRQTLCGMKGSEMTKSIWFSSLSGSAWSARLRSRGLKAVSTFAGGVRRQALCGMEGINKRPSVCGSHPSTDRLVSGSSDPGG